MLRVHQISTLDRPDLQPYRTLRRPLEHHRKGIFVAEGSKVVERLIHSGLEVLSLLTTPEWLALFRPSLEQLPQPPDVFMAERPLLESIVGFHLHQGIMAVGRIPRPAELDDVLLRSPRPYLLVAVDGLTNAENLGVLVRNCVAFGVQAMIVGETSSSPFLRRAVRNSMGAVFTLPVVHVDDLPGALSRIRSTKGIRIVAAHPSSKAQSLPHPALQADCCIVFGSEGEGISARVLAACDDAVAIPMHNSVDSLNVASASAVFLHEARRLREATGHQPAKA